MKDIKQEGRSIPVFSPVKCLAQDLRWFMFIGATRAADI
jgi:hypothetical protein